MGFRLSYGSYQHELAEVGLSISKTPSRSDKKLRTGYTETINITGILHGSSPSALTSKINLLDAAYAVDDQDLIFYDPDGSIARAWRASDGQVRIVSGPNYPNDGRSDAEYTTYRNFSITIEHEVLIPTLADSEDNLVFWQEAITYTPAAEKIVWVELLNGPPVRQLVGYSTAKAVQSGRAVGLSSYIAPPAPLFGSLEIQQARQITYTGPESEGQGANRRLFNYSTTWGYTFEGGSSFSGAPNIR